MDHEIGYGKPPVETRFRTGRSGNPGGRPGPRRAAEKRFQQALEAALLSSPEALLDPLPAANLEVLAKALVCSAAFQDTGLVRMLYELLPERGRRARVPGRLRRMFEQALGKDLRSQGISGG